MNETFKLTAEPGFDSGDWDAGEEELYFLVTKPPTGWTDQDSGILERALDLAGIESQSERVAAAMAVDVMGIVILAPLVKAAEGNLEQIRRYLNHIKGGIGK